MTLLHQKKTPLAAFLLLLLFTNCDSSPDTIQLTYGEQQFFKYRHADINILGSFSGTASYLEYQLNGGEAVPFYAKGVDPEKDKISRNRLFQTGDFNIEIPVDSVDLNTGRNAVSISVTDSAGRLHQKEISFDWDPDPVPLPIDLSDLSLHSRIQQIGQVVNGAFEVDPDQNVIRASEPVAKDVLLLLGSPNGSQEATYSVVFGGTTGNFLGLADFFAGHEAAIPHIGIKPGWSSAGLATIRPDRAGAAQTWLAWGDLLKDDRLWVVKTDPPKPFDFQVGRKYRVRQQVLFRNGINQARFRIWPADESEPTAWLCSESDEQIPDSKIKFTTGSFGLFQFGGRPTTWSEIKVVSLD